MSRLAAWAAKANVGRCPHMLCLLRTPEITWFVLSPMARCMLDAVEALAMNALLLQRPDQALHHTIASLPHTAGTSVGAVREEPAAGRHALTRRPPSGAAARPSVPP